MGAQVDGIENGGITHICIISSDRPPRLRTDFTLTRPAGDAQYGRMKRSGRTVIVLILFTMMFLPAGCGLFRGPEDRLARLLQDQDVPFRHDEDGDLLMTIRLVRSEGAPERAQTVIWRSTVNRAGGAGIREIFSVGARIESEPEADLARELLRDNWETRLTGGWSLLRDNDSGSWLVAYVAKVPEDAPDRYVWDVIRDVALTADALEIRLAGGADWY